MPRRAVTLKDASGGTVRTIIGHSLVAECHLMRGSHDHVIHLDLVHVTAKPFSEMERRIIDRAVGEVRAIYSGVGMTIGYVGHSALGSEAAEEYELITTANAAKRLAQKYRGPHNRSVDVFLVRDMAINAPGSAINGAMGLGWHERHPCSKDQRKSKGCVLGFNSARFQLGFAIAHEVGHVLGLEHADPENRTNLMQRFVGNSSTYLSDGQRVTMRKSCRTRPGC